MADPITWVGIIEAITAIANTVMAAGTLAYISLSDSVEKTVYSRVCAIEIQNKLSALQFAFPSYYCDSGWCSQTPAAFIEGGTKDCGGIFVKTAGCETGAVGLLTYKLHAVF